MLKIVRTSLQFDIRRISSLSLVGYVAWATAAFGVYRASAAWSVGGGISGPALAIALLGLYLLAFTLLATAVPPINRSLRTAIAGVLIACAFGVVMAGPSDVAPILLIVVAVVLAGGYPQRLTWIVLLVLNAALFAVLAWRWHADNAWFVTLVYASFQAFAVVTAGARAEAEASAQQLRLVNAELLATRVLLVESARDAERLRVSRELHDVAGHRLTALKLNLDVLALDAALANRREVAVAQQLTVELLGDIRAVVSRLRQDDGLEVREALLRIAEPFPRPAIHVDVADQLRVHSAAQAEALVRAAQEALTNAVRHAAAANIWITLRPAGTGVELTVRDDGNYRGDHAWGHGLTGMRERVDQVGGSVVTSRSAQGGFEVLVRLPGIAE